MENKKVVFNMAQKQELMKKKWKMQYIDPRKSGLSIRPIIFASCGKNKKIIRKFYDNFF